ncbi:MAG: glycosyltransferase [Phycisphaeraceae bacterium]
MSNTSSNMRIAYLINQYPRVSHSFIRREIQALETLGFDVQRYSLRPADRDELPDPDDQPELNKTRTVLAQGPLRLLWAMLQALVARPRLFALTLALALRCAWRSHRGLIAHLVYLAEACLLHRWLSASDADHLHAHFGTNSATVAMLTSALGGPPFSVTVHGPEEYDKPEALALGEKIRRAAFIAAISDFGRSQLVRWCEPEHWSRVHVVRCAVDTAFLGRATPVPDNANLTCVGRIGYEKGQLLLIEAIARLVADDFPPHLTLVGDGPLRHVVERRIDELAVRDHVTVTGWRSGAVVRQHILDARAMVLPSFAEGLPVVIMEALALHRPVLSTYVAGIPELIEPGVNGWLIPAGSVDALTDALRTVLTTPVDELRAMGEAGAACVARRHHAPTEAATLAALFRRGRAPSADLPSAEPVPRSAIPAPLASNASTAAISRQHTPGRDDGVGA